MTSQLTESSENIAEWFQSQLPYSLVASVEKSEEYGKTHLIISIKDEVTGNLVIERKQKYFHEEKRLGEGNIKLLDQKYSGLGVYLQYLTENYFHQQQGFTNSYILASGTDGGYLDNNGAYVWAAYGYLPEMIVNAADLEPLGISSDLPQALQYALNGFVSKLQAAGVQMPSHFLEQAQSLISDLKGRPEAVRQIAALKLSKSELSPLATQRKPSLPTSAFGEAGVESVWTNLASQKCITAEGGINVGRHLLITKTWGGILYFDDVASMRVREEYVRPRAEKLFWTTFAPLVQQVFKP